MKLTHNIGDVRRSLSDLAKSQVPFATAMALNDTAADVRAEEEKRIATDLDRPKPFTARGFYVKRASKGARPSAAVGIRPIQAGYLIWQVEGGTRGPKRKAVTVPVGIVRDNYGNMRRGALAKLLARPDVFIVSAKTKKTAHLQPGIYKRFGEGGGKGRVKMEIAFEDSATYAPERFDFHGIAMERATSVYRDHFERRLLAAVRSAK